MKLKSYKSWSSSSLTSWCYCCLIKPESSFISRDWHRICASLHLSLGPPCTFCCAGLETDWKVLMSLLGKKEKMVPVRLSLKQQKDYSAGTKTSCSHRAYIYTVRGGYNHHMRHVFALALHWPGTCQDEQQFSTTLWKKIVHGRSAGVTCRYRD